MTHLKQVVILVLVAAALVSDRTCSPAWAAPEPVTVGVLAWRTTAAMGASWQPVADYLSQRLGGREVRVSVFDFPDLMEAAQHHQIDFLVVNPSVYLILRARGGYSAALATLVRRQADQDVEAVGGVIFTRADRTDIGELADLRGKRVAFVNPFSFDAYQAQLWELREAAGLPASALRLVETGMPQDRVVETVLADRADAGFVSAGLIEDMVREGALPQGRLKILHQQDFPAFPVAVSTGLYPEWPALASPQVPDDLSRQVTAALLAMPRVSMETAASFWFTVPADYTAVDELLDTLQLPPHDAPATVHFSDVWRQYRWPIAATLTASATILMLLLLVVARNRQLDTSNRAVAFGAQRLERERLFLQQMMNAVPDLIFFKDNQSVYLGCNEAFARSFIGRPATEIVGRTDLELVPDRDVAFFFRARDREVLAAGTARSNEEDIVLADGRPATVETIKVPFRDSRGAVAGLIGVAREITERKVAEQALRDRTRIAALGAEIGGVLTRGAEIRSMLQECAGAMVQHLDAAFARIWTLGDDGILELQASAGLYTHLNGAHGRIRVGEKKIGLIAARRRPHLTNSVIGDPEVSEQEWAKAEGMVAFAGYPLIVADDVVGVMAMFSRRPLATVTLEAMAAVADEIALGIRRMRSEETMAVLNAELTDRSRQLEAANQELESFNYSVSHDLRAPLRHISGFVREIENGYGSQMPEEAKRFLQMVRTSGERMATMIESLLHLSRVGRAGVIRTRLDLRELAKNAWAEVSATEPERGVDFRLGALPVVDADATLLQQVFVNLLANARKFTKPVPAPRIEVDVQQEKGEQVFSVRDNGVGFDPRHADKLFGAFQRLHSATEFEGTGIGLSIVKRIVEKHGGRIWAESSPGQGATFRFTLSAAPEGLLNDQAADGTGSRPASSGGTATTG